MSAQQLPDQVQYVEPDATTTVEIKGNLSEGQQMTDLSWAWNSSVACFPAIRKQYFTGNHVLYATDLPSYSEMEVVVIPDDPKANLSVYAYQIGANSIAIVPDLSRCVRCEVDHHSDRARVGKTLTTTRTVKDLLALRNPYRVIIGVAGAEGSVEGGYTLQIKLKKR